MICELRHIRHNMIGARPPKRARAALRGRWGEESRGAGAHGATMFILTALARVRILSQQVVLAYSCSRDSPQGLQLQATLSSSNENLSAA